MAVDFLTAEQKAQYGQFAGDPNEIQLARYFHLDEADLTFILNRRGDQNKFGFALQLTVVRSLGCFLSDLTLVPANVQVFVARQLSIGDVLILADYAKGTPPNVNTPRLSANTMATANLAIRPGHSVLADYFIPVPGSATKDPA